MGKEIESCHSDKGTLKHFIETQSHTNTKHWCLLFGKEEMLSYTVMIVKLIY